MEKSERYLIAKHFSDLVVHTKCSEPFLTFLRENNVVSIMDIDVINAIPEAAAKAHKFYTIIQTRKNALPTLIDALRRTNQKDMLTLLTRDHLPERVDIHQQTERRFSTASEAIALNVSPANALFTGRNKELRLLHHKIVAGSLCATKICSIVISGVGGIGKTQLCRKYVQLHQQDFRGNVIWFNGETETSLEQSFSQLAEVLKVPREDVDGKELDFGALVETIYSNLQKRRCLLIFDSVNTGDYLAKFHPMTRIYPQESMRPTIIVTSRETEWGPGTQVMTLSALEPNDAVELVQKSFGQVQCSQHIALDLATGLQFFPLAILQTVSFIRLQRGCTIATYLKDFENRRKAMMSFHSSDICTQLSGEYFYTICTTWEIITQSIRRRSAKSQGQVGMMAIKILESILYTLPDRISIDLLRGFAGKCDKNVVDQALRLLCKYSMISANEDRSLFSVHRLVQEVTRINIALRRHDNKVTSKMLETFRGSLNEDTVDHAITAWRHSNEAIHRKFPDLPAIIVDTLSQCQRRLDGYKFGNEALIDLHKLEAQNGQTCFSKKPHNQWNVTDLKFRKAKCLRLAGRHENALEEFRDLSEEDFKFSGRQQNHPLVFEVHLETGECLHKMGRYDEAIGTLENARQGFRMLTEDRLLEVEVALALVHGEIGTASSNALCEKLLWKCYHALVSSGKNEALLRSTANHLGLHLLEQGRVSEARRILSRGGRRIS